MSIFVEAHVDHPEFVLGPALTACPDVRVEPRYRTHLSPDESSLVFEAVGDDLPAFDEALASDPTVEAFTLVADDGQRLYNVRHAEVQTVTPLVAEVDGGVRSVVCSADGRRLELELPDCDSLRELRRACAEEGVDFRVERLYRTDVDGVGNRCGLTDVQYETLVLAHERGYFATPREATLEELAAETDVSATALGRRLRRAIDRLVTRTLSD
ncbi:MAG: helix-turn-helix domain-containing protein [Haloferacaceae archaeon]